MPVFISMEEAAKHLKITSSTALKYAKKAGIHIDKFGKKSIINHDDLSKLQQQQQQQHKYPEGTCNVNDAAKLAGVSTWTVHTYGEKFGQKVYPNGFGKRPLITYDIQKCKEYTKPVPGRPVLATSSEPKPGKATPSPAGAIILPQGYCTVDRAREIIGFPKNSPSIYMLSKKLGAIDTVTGHPAKVFLISACMAFAKFDPTDFKKHHIEPALAALSASSQMADQLGPWAPRSALQAIGAQGVDIANLAVGVKLLNQAVESIRKDIDMLLNERTAPPTSPTLTQEETHAPNPDAHAPSP